MSLGEEIKYLSSDDIEDMDNDEFDECITDFGQTVSLSEDSEEAKNVRDAILDKIKQTQNVSTFVSKDFHQDKDFLYSNFSFFLTFNKTWVLK